MVKEESWPRQFKNLAQMCSLIILYQILIASVNYRLNLIRNYFSNSFIHVGIGTVCVCLSKDSLSFHCVKGLGSLYGGDNFTLYMSDDS